MRFLLKVQLPTDENTTAMIKNGSFNKIFKSILDDQKPETEFITIENGKRTGHFILNIDDPSQVPIVVEPWFLAFNAGVEITPAFTFEEVLKVGPSIEHAAKKRGLL